MEINRFDVYLISLDPTQGSEIKKTRPCLVISPNEINWNIRTIIIGMQQRAFVILFTIEILRSKGYKYT